jgi:hypothetical protein
LAPAAAPTARQCLDRTTCEPRTRPTGGSITYDWRGREDPIPQWQKPYMLIQTSSGGTYRIKPHDQAGSVVEDWSGSC